MSSTTRSTSLWPAVIAVLGVIVLLAVLRGSGHLGEPGGDGGLLSFLRPVTPDRIDRRMPSGIAFPDATPAPEPTAQPTPEPTPTPAAEEVRAPEPIEIAMAKPPGSLRGWVVDSMDDVVPNATVRLEFGNLKKDGAKGPDLRATTDSLGGFVVEGVPPGPWKIIAEHPGYSVGVREDVTVRSGERTDSLVVVLKPGVKLGGKVANTAGLPLSGATIEVALQTLSVNPLDGQIVRRDTPYRVARSNKEGSFTADRVAPGPAVITATLEGFATERLEFVLTEAAEQQLDITLVPAAQVGGRVRDPLRAAVEGAEVELQDPALKEFSLKAKTGRDGTFRFDGLRGERTYRLFVRAQGFAPAGPIEAAAGRLEILVDLVTGGALSGKVTDLNTGAPRPETAILLESASPLLAVSQRTVTASDGTYRIENLPEGNYHVRVSSTTLTSAPRLDVPVTITDETKGIDFEVYPGIEITGVVVEGQTGDRVENAKVTLSSRVGPAFLQARQAEAITDDLGHFRVSNLPYGLYQLAAAAEGYLVYPGPEATATIELEQGARPEPVTLMLSRGGVIAGRVVGPNDAPVPSAEVRLFNAPGAANIDVGKFATVADTGGGFKFEGIPLNNQVDVYISATAPGLAKGRSDRVTLTSFVPAAEADVLLDLGAGVEVTVEDEGGMRLSDATVSIGHSDFPGDPAPASWTTQTNGEGIALLLNIPSGSIGVNASKKGHISAGRGLVLSDNRLARATLVLPRGNSIKGQVFDDRGGVVKKGVVIASPERGALGRGQGDIDADGFFEIDGLGEGSFTLDARAQRDTKAGVSTVRQIVPNVRVGGGEPRITVPMSGAITGVVIDGATMEPMMGARVDIRGRYDMGLGRMVDFAMGMSTQDPPGEFTFEALPPGTYTATITAPNYLPETVKDILVSSPSTRDLGRIVLDPGGTLVARVVSQGTGEPIAGATVQLKPEGPSGRTNANGEVRISPVTPGMYDVEVRHASYLNATQSLVQVKRRGESDAGTIELRPGGELIGRVWDGEGAPVRGATVTVRITASDEQRAGRTDAGGNVSFDGLPEGGVLITATATLAGQRVTKSLQASVTPAEPTLFEVILSSNATLEGYVLAPAGADGPIQLSLYPLQGDERPVLGGRRNVTVRQGYFREENLAEGRYLLAASTTRAGRVVTWHDVARVNFPKSTTTVYAPNRRISGRAVDGETGEPAPGATVIVRALTLPQTGVPALREWWEWASTTGPNGEFQFSDLAPGTYEIIGSSADGLAAGDIVDLYPATDVTGYQLQLLP